MAKSVWLMAAATILMVFGSGCTVSEKRYVTEPLPLPVRPVLPQLSADEAACLSDETYRRLVDRDRLRREYAEKLEVIIRSTH